jgi:hypothetical protein
VIFKRYFVNALTFLRMPLILAWLALALVQEFGGGFWPGFWALGRWAACTAGGW